MKTWCSLLLLLLLLLYEEYYPSLTPFRYMQLLAEEIRKERNIVLQSIRYIMRTDFFALPDEVLEEREHEHSSDLHTRDVKEAAEDDKKERGLEY